MQDWLPVFRTGTHTDSNGDMREWTEGDLKAIASSYDPAAHEAPVVVGHPRDNAPAWGWVEALKAEGGYLYAKLKGLIPEFTDMVNKGMFKKRSISLYPDMALRHIGFLGAMPPAVKGLPDVRFGERDKGAVTMEFDKFNQKKEEKKMSIMQKLKDLLKSEGVEVDEAQSFSEAEVTRRVEAGLKAREAEFSEKAAAIEEARAKQDAALKEREEALSAAEAGARRKDIASFCEGLLKDGRLTPAMMKHGMGLVAFMEAVGSVKEPVEFSDGGGTKKETPLEFMKSFLSGLPKNIEFSETAGAGKDTGGDREALINSFLEKNKGTYKDAVLAVSKERPELFKQ